MHYFEDIIYVQITSLKQFEEPYVYYLDRSCEEWLAYQFQYVTGNSCPLPTVIDSLVVGYFARERWDKSGMIWSEALVSVNQFGFWFALLVATIDLAAMEASLARSCLPW